MSLVSATHRVNHSRISSKIRSIGNSRIVMPNSIYREFTVSLQWRFSGTPMNDGSFLDFEFYLSTVWGMSYLASKVAMITHCFGCIQCEKIGDIKFASQDERNNGY